MKDRGLIIVFGSEKGGSGKTTCATNIAVELTLSGYKVLIIDSDRQRTSSKWIERRDQEIENGASYLPIRCIEKIGKIKNTIEEMSNYYDVVIVDPAGRDSAELRSSLLIADFLYTPTQPSQFDLETIDDISNLYEETKEYNSKLIAFSIINQAPTHFGTREALEASEYISDFSNIILCKSIIKARKAYRIAPRQGAGVVEYTDESAKNEIKLLTQEIIQNAKKYSIS